MISKMLKMITKIIAAKKETRILRELVSKSPHFASSPPRCLKHYFGLLSLARFPVGTVPPMPLVIGH